MGDGVEESTSTDLLVLCAARALSFGFWRSLMRFYIYYFIFLIFGCAVNSGDQGLIRPRDLYSGGQGLIRPRDLHKYRSFERENESGCCFYLHRCP
jgi:hypothetical protein